eukprot:TRINITY_DN20056_c0_g1_i3.p1 TRINITY_DN20056_c0_g1~~TRINITY_DN20056_c0_g1_i3.p1  ORF type:complete len:917 (+),score=146.43 TRINITY_DN20056_c0_g1_i3:83-2833(+)
MSSFYASAIWQKGKKGPPPIFTSIGVRHPEQIELDLALRDQTTLPALLELVGQHIQRFDAGNTVIAVAQIPKVQGPRSLRAFSNSFAWQELQRRMYSSLTRLEPRGLSMLAYALARLEDFEDSTLLEAVLDKSLARMDDFGPTDAAKLAWVMAKGQMKHRGDLWAALSREATRKICSSGRFIDISMTAWAFAKAGVAERVLFGQLATAAMECTELPPHTIANLCWAFAKSKNHNPPLFDMLAKRSIESYKEFDRQSVSNLVWAYATLDVCHEELFSVFAAYTVESGLWREFSPQMASNMLWAYGKVNVAHMRLFDTFAEFISINIDSFDNQNIANTAWAYATTQLPSEGVFNILTCRSRGRLSTFRMDELCGLMWAYVKAKPVSVAFSPIFEEAVQLLMPQVPVLDAQSVSNVIWILATCQQLRKAHVHGAPELIDSLMAAMLDMRVRVDSEGAAQVVWSLWRMGRFHDAWTLYVRTLSDGRHPEHGKSGFTKKHAVDGRQRYYQTLLMETESRGDLQKQVFLWKQMAADFYSRNLRTACLNCALMAMLKARDVDGAKEMLRQAVRTKLHNKATPGDARSVHAAIENVGLKEVWLKVAGGEKACVIDNVILKQRPKLILEFGTYVGYTSTRMALQVAQWGGKVVTMEMDPVNATIARNHIQMAGLSHAVTVQLGHSDDAVQCVLDKYGEQSVDMVFMDQRGTAFHDDLQRLESLNLLHDRAVVVADNVLKPGAPYHVWRISSMPHYKTDIVDLREFGSAPVEDWMTVSWTRRGESYGKPAQELRELNMLARESDRFRLRAMATSMKDLVGDPLDEFAERFTSEFVALGIRCSLYVQTDVVDGCAVSRLVRLEPGQAPPKWDGEDPREEIQGGQWRAELGTVQFRGEMEAFPMPAPAQASFGGYKSQQEQMYIAPGG